MNRFYYECATNNSLSSIQEHLDLYQLINTGYGRQLLKIHLKISLNN